MDHFHHRCRGAVCVCESRLLGLVYLLLGHGQVPRRRRKVSNLSIELSHGRVITQRLSPD
jgi:hypothetical protein